MSRKLLIATTIVLTTALAPYMVNAAEAEAAAPNPDTMSKDNWLGAMSPLLPSLICKGFMQDEELKKRFDELHLTYDQCVSQIPESANKCQNEIYAEIPETVDKSTAGVWGKKLGECIGKDYAEKHLIPKS